MKQIANVVLLVINILSFVVSVVFCVFGIYEQIMGPADAKKLLEKLNIPLNYKQVLLLGFACIALLFISCVLKGRLS